MQLLLDSLFETDEPTKMFIHSGRLADDASGYSALHSPHSLVPDYNVYQTVKLNARNYLVSEKKVISLSITDERNKRHRIRIS